MNPDYQLPPWFGAVFKSLLIEVFLLLSLGASVRVFNAGLACPDWPFCFGDVIPDFHPQVYLEFLHRVFAGIVMIVTTWLVVVFCRRSKVPRAVKWLGISTIVLLLAQALLGALTVRMQLSPFVVAAHLTMGTGLYAILLWIYSSLKSAPVVPVEDRKFKPWALLMVSLIFIQIILGGLVASHYAAAVCSDFPKCYGQWFPSFSGILGLHVIHRSFAYLVVLGCILNFWWIRRTGKSLTVRRMGNYLFGFVSLQFLIGVANVIFFTPPFLAIIHLTVATALLGFATYYLRFVTR